MGLRVQRGTKERGMIKYLVKDLECGFYPPDKKAILLNKKKVINSKSR